METLDAYLAALASDSPAPGGGSAAAVAGALGAALVAMVARITGANPKYAARLAEAAALVAAADEVRAALETARRDDERAFGLVVTAQALPKGDEAQRAARAAALQAAFAQASAAPLRTAELSLEVLGLSRRGLALENRHLTSDLGCAAELAAAAISAAALNVRANHPYIKNAEFIVMQTHALERLESERDAGLTHIRAALQA
jgi:formiminotetrahydrofolate cyclodeaminase